MKKVILLIIFFVTVSIAQFKNASISGFVYDKTTGETLFGANVFINEINRGAVTNVYGYFSIPKLSEGIYEINFSYIGYRTEKIKISLKNGEDKKLKIYLVQDIIQGKEIVIKADSVRIVEKLFNKPVSNFELSPKQIQSVPRFIEADLLRTLQSLPGIVPLSDFSSAIYVRGGTPDQNLFMIDGTDVYNPEHAFGLFSTFNTDAIKKVEVFKGGFGAEYGGRLSSVIDIINNDGNRNFFEGKTSLSLLSLSSTFSGPIGSIGSVSGSIRRTYLDQTLAKWVNEVPNYYFVDGNLKAFFDLSNSNKLSISYFGSKDNLNFVLDKKRPESLGFDYIWGNQTGSINLRSIFDSNLFGNFWITFSHFNSYFDFDDVGVKEDNTINDLTFKGNLEYFYSENFNFKFGFEQKNANGGLKQNFPGGIVDASKSRKLYSVYSSATWKPNLLLNIEFGLRGDYFISDKVFKNLDPRFNLKYRLSENANIKFSAGIFHQYANRIPRLFFVSIWTTADSFVNGSSSNHYIFGYQRALGEKFEIEFESYYKSYKDIYAYNQNYVADVIPSNYTNENVPVYNNQKGLFTRGDGNSYGIEFLIRKEIGAITGWFSYSFSRTNYKFDNFNQGKSFIPRHNRTHAINLVANIDLNNFLNELKEKTLVTNEKQWLLGFNFTFFSGQPITLPSSVYLFTQFPDWQQNKNSLANYPSTINAFSLPYYARFDFSLTYEINYDGWSLSPYLQVFNLFNRKNVWFIQYKNEIVNGLVKQKIENVNMFPILPSIGITIKF